MFTMEQYIKTNGLNVDVKDPRATKLLRDHFAKMNLVRVRRSGKWIWVAKADVPDYAALEQKLGQLEKGVKGNGKK